LLTEPGGGLGLGEVLVLISAVFWAAQVILVSKYGGSNPILFSFFESIPAIGFILMSSNRNLSDNMLPIALPYLAYLGLMCTDAAFALQVYGQRWLKPYEAALIFILEPVFAAFFSTIILGVMLGVIEVFGAILIIAGMLTALMPWRR